MSEHPLHGLYDMTDEAYFQSDAISRSKLDWIHPPRTPLHYKAKFIDKMIPDEETPAMRLGSLTHRAILRPDTMDGAFHVKPDGMKFSNKEGIAWRDSHEDKPIITADDYNSMKGMRDAVWRHPLAKRLLSGASTEQSAFVEQDGLILKARFDAIPKGGNAIPDLKTCEDASLEAVEKAMASRLYYRQAAFYLKVDELLKMGHAAFLFIFVEKSYPFACAVYQLGDDVIDAGRMTIERDLQTLRNCIEKDEWPGYGFGAIPCGLPAFMMKRLESEI